MGSVKPILKIGIVGAGPWGVAVLDRLIARAAKEPSQHFEVVVFDPATPGPGVHSPDQPAHLLLNTVTGQVDSFSARHFGAEPLPGALSFLEWARKTLNPDTSENGFLPRRQFGFYMEHVFATLVSNLPTNLELTKHATVVTDLTQAPHGQFILSDGEGDQHIVDHAFVCTGHGHQMRMQNKVGLDGALDAYPCSELGVKISSDCIVGVQGMGLTAVDVVATLTEGRGGVFVECKDTKELTYQPSGREPVVYCFSRSGMLFSCRPAESLDLSGQFDPLFCDFDALPANRSLDFVQDVLPLLTAEMWAAFVLRHLALTQGLEAATQMRQRLSQAGSEAAEEIARTELGDICKKFDPRSLLLGRSEASGSTAGEAARILQHLERDVSEAAKGEAGSPYKHAIEMLRVNREFIRKAVNHDRLTAASNEFFFTVVAPAIAQLIVGPPLSRGREWLALVKAGILRFELCKKPEILRDNWSGFWTARTQGHVAKLNHLIRARVGEGWLSDPLMLGLTSSGMCARVRTQKLSYLRVDSQSRPIDATGLPIVGISLLGVPSEGSTYFNHYLPSPRSRADAFERIDSAISEMLQRANAETRDAA